MRHGVATVTKAEGTNRIRVTVRVAVERPGRPELSYLRCAEDRAPEACRAAALSGARYARQAVDRDRFGIEVCEVRGDLDHPAAEEGAAMAALFATWRAWGHRWTAAEAPQTTGWALHEDDGP